MSNPSAQSALGIYADHRKFAEKCLKIRDKNGINVPAKLSPAGERLVEAVEDFDKRGEPARIIFLKARQVWVSAAVASLFYKLVRFNPGQRCQIIADIEKNSKNIAGYYEQYNQSLTPPSIDGHTIAPVGELVKSQASQGWWQWEGGSEIIVQTARNVQSGRSFSARLLHLSEFAFFQDAATLTTGLMQTMPKTKGTIAVVESTANGYGGEFHRLWQLSMGEGVAVEWADDLAWKGLFFAWWEHPEYSKPLRVEPHAFQQTLTKNEVALQQNHGVSLEQLNWRRWTIANDCMGDERRFQQEYPAHPEEAFLTSGRTRFDMGAVSRMPSDHSFMVGNLERVAVGPELKIVFQSNPTGWLRVFRRPALRHQYIMGVDTAQGIADEDSKHDPDYSVAQILDRETGEQCATVHGRFEPGYMAELCFLLGEWYGWAFMVPESNNTGVAFIMKLRELDYPLDRIYREETDPRRVGSGQPNRLGFLTTRLSRPKLIHALDSAIREQAIIVYNPRTISELRTFVRHEITGEERHQQGAHDDEVFSLALAVVGLGSAPHFAEMKHELKSLAPISYEKKAKKGKRGEVVRLM